MGHQPSIRKGLGKKGQQPVRASSIPQPCLNARSSDIAPRTGQHAQGDHRHNVQALGGKPPTAVGTGDPATDSQRFREEHWIDFNGGTESGASCIRDAGLETGGEYDIRRDLQNPRIYGSATTSGSGYRLAPSRQTESTAWPSSGDAVPELDTQDGYRSEARTHRQAEVVRNFGGDAIAVAIAQHAAMLSTRLSDITMQLSGVAASATDVATSLREGNRQRGELNETLATFVSHIAPIDGGTVEVQQVEGPAGVVPLGALKSICSSLAQTSKVTRIASDSLSTIIGEVTRHLQGCKTKARQPEVPLEEIIGLSGRLVACGSRDCETQVGTSLRCLPHGLMILAAFGEYMELALEL